jgi:hypothetical protein
LRGLLAESAVIFTSVLAALWADAMWQNRADRGLEQYYLRALHAEMVVALQELDADQSRREAQLMALDSLSGRLGRLGTPPADLALWVDGIAGEFFYAPPETVINEISETGRLQLFEDAQLRAAIMTYRRARTRLAGQEETGATLWQDALFPHLLANAPRTLRGEADTKSVGQMLALLHLLGKDVDVVISQRPARQHAVNRRRRGRGTAAV